MEFLLLRKGKFGEEQVWEEEDQELGFGPAMFQMLIKPLGGC